MIFVDSSVWIDYFRGIVTAETDCLDGALGRVPILIGDIILTEVLQGFSGQQDFDMALRMFATLDHVDLGGREICIQAARNFRHLRSKGVTVRKTIDTLIATRCIADGLPLLFGDRDFEPFVEHLGLVSAL